MAQYPSTRPRHRGNGGDAESLVDRRPTRIVDSGDDMLDAEGLPGNTGDEDVGVVATGDGCDRAVRGDPGLGQHVAVEADAHHGRALEVVAQSAK